MEQEDKYVLTFLGGAVLGFVVGGYLALSSNDVFNNAKVFRDENRRPVMRLYREGGDEILVGTDESGEAYIRLETHLKDIQDPNDRKVERAKIEKLVRWED